MISASPRLRKGTMTLEQIDSYLIASREYLTRASHTLSGLGTCCTGTLDKLWARQEYLEGLSWQARHNAQDGLGQWQVPILIVGSLLAALGAEVYTHYTASKSTSEYYDCFNRVFEQYKAAGYDEVKASEQASIVCKGTSEAPISEKILGVVKMAVYAAVGIAAVYLITSLIRK